MDLRSILDNSDTGDREKEREREQRERERAAQLQQQPPTPQQQSHQIPQHHQSPASYPYRDYGPPSQHHPSQPSPGKPPGRQEYPPHQPQHAYNPPQSPYQQPSAYPRQSVPPPLQPSASFQVARSPAGMPAPSPTAYRPTPTPTHAQPGAPGGYPFPQQDITSPSMRHQYPPGQYPPQPQRQGSLPPQRQDSYSHGVPYAQQGAPVPHPSPGGTPGAQYPRSQSQHSTPPTSAHSQQYASSYIHGSPVAMPHPPQTVHSQTSPRPPHQAGPHPLQQQPHPPPQQPHLPIQQQPHPSPQQQAHHPPQQQLPHLPPRAAPIPEPMAVDTERERAITPAKRKLEDRDLSPLEVERKAARPSPAQVNGDTRAVKSESLAAKPRKVIRKRYPDPPTWAQNFRKLSGKLPKHPNYVLAERVHSHINGNRKQATPEKRASPPPQQPPPPVIAAPDPRDQLGPWEATITGIKPLEEIPKQVTDFLILNVVAHEDAQEIAARGIKFEIEAKLGTLINKDTNQRVDLNALTECILANSNRVAFKSSMTEAHHKFFNDSLNDLVRESRAVPGRLPLEYRHHRQVDSFIDLTPELQRQIPGCMSHQQGSRRNLRVRVSRDQKTKEVIGKIVKTRVADLDIHFPNTNMDCRISVNLEMDWDGPIEELEQLAANQRGDRQPDRGKDRLTYTHGHYQIDLTQVTQQLTTGGQQRVEKEHELEIELNADMLVQQGRKIMNGEPHRLPELIEGMVDNIRVLARKSTE